MSLTEIFSLTKRTAFITGASSGLGLHLASVLANAGASVALAARRVESIKDVSSSLNGKGHKTCAVFLDVNQRETIPAAFDAAESALGAPIDILINNAGIIYFSKFLDQNDVDVSRVIDTNLKGAFAVAQEGARRMVKARTGAIINVASSAGLRAAGFLSSYASSKAGLIHLSEIMALELGTKGVRVNVICPGNFVTDMHQTFTDQGLEEGILKRIPLRRFGSPDDLDGAVLLLASDAGRYITGAVVKVDGGQTLSWL